MMNFLQQRRRLHGIKKILGMITCRPVGTQGDVDTLAQHLHNGSDTVSEHHITHWIVRHRRAGLLEYGDFFFGNVNGVSEDSVIPRDAEPMQKLNDARRAVFVLHAFQHRPRLGDMGAYSDSRSVCESTNLFEQRRRGVDRRRVRPGHEAEFIVVSMPRKNRFDSSECSFRRLARAVRHDFSGVHDRPGKYRPKPRLFNGPHRFKRALRVGIKEVMFADRCHAAANRFDATEQRAGIEMVRS